MNAFPVNLPLVLDRSVRHSVRERVLVGGDPRRALRLSAGGSRALAHLQRTGAGSSVAARRLARTLTDAGLAHPRPTATAARGVTVVVPVRDRPDALDTCLAAAGAAAVVVDDGSRDAAAIAAVCTRHGARLIRHATPRGPAAARNSALAHVDTTFVAFLDSDCVPEPGWLDVIAGHFADPLVAAVAPRVRGVAATDAGTIGRFAAARSPLDMGEAPARVAPGGRVAYVPTAALVVRRGALGDGFDAVLRYGEDVDLVWRLHDAGWRVRYEPAATVEHREPAGWCAISVRRFHYGTSAAPLSARHPGRLAPLVVRPGPAAVAGLALTGRARWAALLATAQGVSLARRMRRRGLPVSSIALVPLRQALATALAAGRAGTMLAPAVLLAAATTRRGRAPALALLAGPPLAEWVQGRPPVDALRWTLLCLADDAAYGAGVWVGCLRAPTAQPLLPMIASPSISIRNSGRASPATRSSVTAG